MPIILGSFWGHFWGHFGCPLFWSHFGVIFRCGVLSGHLVGEGLKLVGSLVGSLVGEGLKLVGSLVGSLVGKPVGGGAEQVWWCGPVGLGI